MTTNKGEVAECLIKRTPTPLTVEKEVVGLICQVNECHAATNWWHHLMGRSRPILQNKY